MYMYKLPYASARMPRFLVHRIYASYCEEANVQDIYILDKMRVFFVEMYYVNSFKDIVYKKKKEGKIDRSISVTKYKCFDIVKMFHGL